MIVAQEHQVGDVKMFILRLSLFLPKTFFGKSFDLFIYFFLVLGMIENLGQTKIILS